MSHRSFLNEAPAHRSFLNEAPVWHPCISCCGFFFLTYYLLCLIICVELEQGGRKGIRFHAYHVVRGHYVFCASQQTGALVLFLLLLNINACLRALKKMIAINPIIINIINATYWSTLKINNTLCTGNCFGMDANDIESTLSQLMTAPSQSSERWSFPRQVPLHSPLPADYKRVCSTSSWGSTSAACWWATPWSEALQWSPPWWHTRGPGSK